MKQKQLVFGLAIAAAFAGTATCTAYADSVDDYINRNIVNTANEIQSELAQASVEHCTMGGETQAPVDPQSKAFAEALNQPTPSRVQPELGVGITKYSLTGNGTWYQEGFPYRANLTNENVSIGLKVKVTDDIHVRAGFQDLGSVSSHAKASASDENYAECKGDHSKCWPLSTWYGQGDVKQAYLTIEGEHKFFGIPFVAEAGMVVYKPTWTETIPDWISSPTAAPQLVVVSHTPKLLTSTIVGAGVRINKNTTLMLDWEKTPASGDQYPAIYSGSTYSLQVRQEF